MNRFIVIPVRSDGKVVAAAGVASKKEDYDESDVSQLGLMMDSVWKSVERCRAEESFWAKSEELERYFLSSLDLLCIADTGGRFIRLNPEWEKVLGYALSELEGGNFLDFVHPDDIESTREALSSLGAQERVLNFENRYRCRDGSYRWIEWRSYPHGNLVYAAARDITVRKRIERELEESLDEKESLLRELQHRVKNSLATISSLVRLEIDKSESRDTRAALRTIQGRIETLSELYSMLYDTGETRDISLGQYLHKVVLSIRESQVPADFKVKIEAQMVDPVIDARRASSVGLILNELLMNAIRHGFPGGRSGLISTTLEREGDLLVLGVMDDGVGFPPGFTIASSKGLGLTLVKMLARQLGGDTAYESGPGGTRFRVSVPVCQ